MAAPARKQRPDRAESSTVGIRELRQNLTRYLRRVKTGETLEVTEHGLPVAVLAPLPPANENMLDRLIREGHARPAQGDLRDIGPPIKLPPGSPSVSEILDELREDIV